MKKAILISYYDWYDKRLRYLHDILIKENYKVKYYTSNFDHINKCSITINMENRNYINVPKYRSNISIMRIISLCIFVKKIKKILKTENPDLVYCVVPPNLLVKEIANMKSKMNYKLIFDVIDMWPESLPINKFNDTPFYKVWSNLRIKLYMADYVVTECDRYQKVLNKFTTKDKLETIRLVRKFEDNNRYSLPKSNTLKLCYLGSINNIIDIDSICLLIKNQKKFSEVELHIIGDGTSRDIFVNKTEEAGAKVYYYGKIFDDYKKKIILNKCHYGINLYKQTTLIGLTIKCLDYFDGGLPIINNIKGDTEEIINKYNIGINLNSIEKSVIYDDIDYKEYVFNTTRDLFDENRILQEFIKLVSKIC